MNGRLRVLSVAPLLTAFLACTTTQSDDAVTNDDAALTAGWFAKNLPKGSALEKAVLALANDKGMTADDYVDQCQFSVAASAAIVDYRPSAIARYRWP